MPLELAHDLATLALYDIVIFADDSGSMIFEEGGERINDLKLILGRVAEVATLFDEDGKRGTCLLCAVQQRAQITEVCSQHQICYLCLLSHSVCLSLWKSAHLWFHKLTWLVKALVVMQVLLCGL